MNKQKTEPAILLMGVFSKKEKHWFEAIHALLWGFPGGAGVKESAGQGRRRKKCGFDPWVAKIPRRRAWQPTPVFLPGESHRQRSLAGYSPRGPKESDMSDAAQQQHALLWPLQLIYNSQDREATQVPMNRWMGKKEVAYTCTIWSRKCSPRQYSSLENPMRRRAWQAAVHWITQSQTRLKCLSMHSVHGDKTDRMENMVNNIYLCLVTDGN